MKIFIIGLHILLAISATLVMLMPGVIVIGLLALLVPGLILAALPTLFMWYSAFAISWWGLRLVIPEKMALLPAAMVAAALVWFVPQASISESQVRMAAATKMPDLIPSQRITLAGDILLSVPRLDVMQRQPGEARESDEERMARPWVCDALCAALLASPGVRSVTLITNGTSEEAETRALRSRTLSMLPKAQCPAKTIMPINPGGLDIDPPEPENGGIMHIASSLGAEWNLRLSTTHCIVAEAPKATFDMIVTHRSYSDAPVPKRARGVKMKDNKWSFDPEKVNIDSFTVSNRQGQILLRKTIATTAVLARPLYIGMAGGLENFHLAWARSARSSGPRYEQIKPAGLLARYSNLSTGGNMAALIPAVRKRLTEMLDDRNVDADDPGFDLLRDWFASFKPPSTVSNEDSAFLIRLISDPRIVKYDGLYAPIKAMGDQSLALRAVIGRRLLTADPMGPWMKTLAAQYESMPTGTFLTGTADEAALLADPERRLYAGGLIVRQSDRGAAAVPMLVVILRTHLERRAAPDRERGNTDDLLPIDSARRALCLLGPDARTALPEVRDLQREGLLTPQMLDDREWQFVLARLGVPVDDIPKPENVSGTADNFHKNLRNKLKHFDPARNCEAEWS
ncbi:hypothetical protein [Sphingobium boeckii]|uniref:Uncharacterized protein n=1 Tax=Sphingobium boeckii TaxID=1082345 RepID=A0A7W9AI63_9SPHN|nr:hypothetical protein [Sphingobium boeckii]MBB5686038.1 hypothetical protein [Sphingobium boeckii]